MFEKNLVNLALLFYNAINNVPATYQLLHLHEIIGILSEREEMALEKLKRSLRKFINNYCLVKSSTSLKNSAEVMLKNSFYEYYLREVIMRNIQNIVKRGDRQDESKIIYPIKIDLGKYFIYTAFDHSSLGKNDDWDILKVYYGIGNKKICYSEVISEEYGLAGPESVVDIIHKVNSKIIGFLNNSNINIPVDIQRELLPINYSLQA